AGEEDEIAMNERRGAWGVAVIEVARGWIEVGPDVLAGLGIDAIEDVRRVQQLAVGEEDEVARRGHAAKGLGGEALLPDDFRLGGEFVRQPGNAAVGVGAAPGGPFLNRNCLWSFAFR